MLTMWHYGMTHPQLDFKVFYPLYLLFLALYMPTMALANTTTFGLLTQSGLSTVTDFPRIRVWGTVGFVAAMWFVNSAYWSVGGLGFTFSDKLDASHLRFQYNSMQLLCSSIMGFVTAIYAFCLPKNAKFGNDKKDIGRSLPLRKSIRSMFGTRDLCIFLIFVVFSGVCLQISNGFVTPYISHFSGIEEYANSLASGNATMLFSLSQISEALCILLVGIALKWRGIRWVYALGLLAWSLRFLTLGFGNPTSGLWLLIGSMLIYGIAFNFITIAGHIYIQQASPEGMKGFAQGLMMFMSNGIGATFGTLGAGAIINHWCAWQMVPTNGMGTSLRLFMGEWIWPWLIFAAYAFAVMLAWLIFFKAQTPLYRK